MIFVVGGGGKLKNTDAVLVVTAPTGSTVTATKGGTTLTPTMWVKAADNTLDCAIFNIPASQFDSTTPWTITATDGTNTASTTVLITANKEYEVTLSYNYYLFKSGIGQVVPLSSGHEANSSISIGTSEISTNYTSSAGYQVFCCNTNAIDLSAFSALCVEGIIAERQTSSQYGGIIAVTSSMMANADDATTSKYVAKVPILTGSRIQTTALDISSVNISGYVGIKGGMKGTISAIYLKP